MTLSYQALARSMRGDQQSLPTPSLAASSVDGAPATPTVLPAPQAFLVAQFLDGAYALSPNWVVDLQSAYLTNDATLVRDGALARAHESGLGDTKLTFVRSLYQGDSQTLEAGAGMSFPTGSVSLQDNTGHRLPAPLQLGSGTRDGVLSLGYRYRSPHWSTGALMVGLLRTGRNAYQERLGNQLSSGNYLAYVPTPYFSPGVKFNVKWGGPTAFGPTSPKFPTAASLVWDADLIARSTWQLWSQEMKAVLDVSWPFAQGRVSSVPAASTFRLGWMAQVGVEAAF